MVKHEILTRLQRKLRWQGSVHSRVLLLLDSCENILGRPTATRALADVLLHVSGLHSFLVWDPFSIFKAYSVWDSGLRTTSSFYVFLWQAACLQISLVFASMAAQPS